MENKRLLLVEDDADIASLLELHLSDLGATVTLAKDGHEGMRLAINDTWDLVILDIQLPGPSGLEICRQLRKQQAFVPILLLTSRASELDRVLGLDLGADDYITKPFSVMECIARINALLRRVDALQRQQQSHDSRPIQLGRLHINSRTHDVQLNNTRIELTAREFDLLQHFASQPGRVYRRSELLDSVWGYGHDGYEHTVNSHINRLRAKIEDNPTEPKIIVTVWGVGYKLDPAQLSG